ncbi:MAG: 5-oxoprolinase subunit PxpB [Alphaproteobacteria bacterium]
MGDGSLTRVGESALLLRPDDPGEIPRLLLAVDSLRNPRVRDVVPGADSLLVVFDDAPLADVEEQLRFLLAERRPRQGASGATEGSRAHVLRVVYDGPDLERVGRSAGLSTADVVDLHRSAEYRVAFVGFQPGFAYLAGLPERLATPRLATPRTRVPPGSLAIGGEWTGFYPSASPGGWNLVGRTGQRLFDPSAERPALLSPGDLVRIEPA